MASRFMWYELLTSDVKAAEAFYRQVVGWDAQEMSPPPNPYVTFNTRKGGVAGLTLQSRGPGPVWIGYVGVDDVDAYAARVTQAGGTVHTPPADIPGIGRSSMVADPQGAVFVLFKGSAPQGPPTGDADEPGYIGWHELMARDGKAAFDFYSRLFGWTATEVYDGQSGVRPHRG